MSEIPEEIRCFLDAEKVCPLRSAVSTVRAMNAAPEDERPSMAEYEDTLQEVTLGLSNSDRKRFYAMTDPDDISQDLRPGTCRSGPHRTVPLVGRMSCGAATVHYV
jgi:hypothetical protein